MYYIKMLIILIPAILILISCATKEAPPQTPAGPVAPTGEEEKPTAKEAWEEKWERALQAAKKEGTLVVYASTVAPTLKEVLPQFKKKYGFGYEVVTGRGAETRERLLQERRNGLFIADVFISGLNTIFGAVKKSGALEPLEPELILPEVLDPKLWYGSKLPWADDERLVFSFFYYPLPQIAVNTELMRVDEIKSYYDLIGPKWKGKIIIGDPTVTGSAFDGFASLLFNKILDLDYFRQLASQQNLMLRDQRLQIDWLIRGKYSIALWPRSVNVAEFQDAGAPVAFSAIPVEGTYASVDGGNVVLVNRAPHPNAARVFINWLLSKEGQAIMQNSLKNTSSRIDLPDETADPLKVRQPGVKYFIAANSIEKWVLEEQDRYLELAKQVFAPLTVR